MWAWPVCLAVMAAGGAMAGARPAVAAGSLASFKLGIDGTIWAWGDNGNGALGDGTGLNRFAPVPLRGLSGMVGVAAGAVHGLALKDDGTVWAWGWNRWGQVGDGTAQDRYAPVQVAGVSGVVAVAAGVNHSLAVKNDGTVWTWGGAVAFGMPQEWWIRPTQVPGLSGVVAAAGGYNTSLALKRDGTVWMWSTAGTPAVQVSGLNGVVAIAEGYFHSLALKSDGTVWAWDVPGGSWPGGGTPDRTTPTQVSGLAGVVAVDSNGEHSLALRDDGTVWAWGANENGQLGDGTTVTRSTPVQVVGLRGVASIAAGIAHSLAVKRDGTVFAWGESRFGVLGDGTPPLWYAPLPVSNLDGVTGMAAGADHSLAVRSDGTAWAWGKNTSGQLGNGSCGICPEPVPVGVLSGVTAIDAGQAFSLAVKSDGTAWAWGANASGQLGNGSSVASSVPAQVSGLTGVTAVNAGGAHSLALINDGTVWAWGANEYGQLGDGTTVQRLAPVRVSGLSAMTAVAAGEWHSLARKGDGTVWAWGIAALWGGGTNSPGSLPAPVSGLSGIVAVAAGGSHAMALKNDGTVWTWGSNSSGQLGIGPGSSWASQPVQISGLAGVVSIAAGANHSLAAKSDGTVWIWGTDANGQPGDGSAIRWYRPVLVSGLSDIATVSAGSAHSLALTKGGIVWAWGAGLDGQLGNGSIWFKATPIPTLPTTLPGTRTINLDRFQLSFGGVTGAAPVVSPAQEVVLTQSGPGTAAWTASTDKPWLVVSPTSGVGGARVMVSILSSALPALGANSATVTFNSADAVNTPITVSVTLQMTAGVSPPFGVFDTPLHNATGLSGSVAVTGWALDNIGVNKVTIWRDRVGAEGVYPNGYVYIGDATFVAGARPDVEARFPFSPNAIRAGWGYLMLTNGLPAKGNGTFTLHAIAVDEEGNQVKLGSKTITVDNAHAVRPFGALDSPAPGQTISGSSISSGWALTPQPASIAADGSTIWLNIDGVNVGHPIYGLIRPDVAAIFPGLANSGASGGQAVLDSANYTNGVHTIAWIVYDNQGHGDGIGSRFFTVLNAAAAGASVPGGTQTAELAPERRRLVSMMTLTRPSAARRDTLSYRKGHDLNAALLDVGLGDDGEFETVELAELDRVELHLPAMVAGAPWTGRLRFADELRPLPIGSTLDEENGVFYWQLAPGFLGEYQLEFSRPDVAPTVVRIRVGPKELQTGAGTERSGEARE